jgi:hypothetical protein
MRQQAAIITWDDVPFAETFFKQRNLRTKMLVSPIEEANANLHKVFPWSVDWHMAANG